MKPLRPDFGLDEHEGQHFEQHDEKPVHGVWGANLQQVRKWLNTALGIIRDDGDQIVGWRASPARNRKGGYNILVDMGQPIGNLGGYKADPDGSHPVATHIEVSLRKNGQVSNAFPSDPKLF